AYRAAEALSEELEGVILEVDGSRAVFGSDREVLRHADGQSIACEAGGFSQAHGLNERLVQAVANAARSFSTRRGLSPLRVLELYSGYGNFTVALAHAHEVTAVELDASAVMHARANLAQRGLSAKLVEGDSDAHAERDSDLLLVDPPRAGARHALAGWLGVQGKGPRCVLYVSCDTATLRRDLGMLRGAGFRVVKATAFDLFPQTAHVESFVVLER
ncbi:MAG: methyltransferase domain-containing protein, partial [Myxococcota bacterium]